MKIESLKIENFCNHVNSLLKFGHVNFIQGPIAQGKSSVLDAIRWILPGYCRNMKNSSDREGELNLIRLNSDKATVAITFNNGNGQMQITKSRTKSGQTIYLRSIDGNKVIKQEDIFRLVNNNNGNIEDAENSQSGQTDWKAKYERKISAAMDGMRGLLELDGKKRKQLLFDLLGVILNYQLIRDHLSRHDILEPFLSKVAEVVIKEGFEEACQKAVDKRKEFKGKLKELNIIEPTDRKVLFGDSETDLSKLDGEKVMQAHEELKSEQERLLKRSGELEAMEKNDVVKLDQKVWALKPEIEKTQVELDRIYIDKDFDKEIKVLQDSVQDHEKQIKKSSDKIIGLKSEISLFEKQAEEIKKLGDKCPKCHSQLTPEIKQKIADQINVQLKSRQVELDSEIKHEKQLRDSLKDIFEKLSALKTLHEDIKTKQKRLKELTDEREELNQKIKTAEKRKVSVDEIGEVQDQLEGLKQELAETELLKNDVKKYQDDFKVFTENIDKQKKYNEAIKIYDKLAKLLAPDGIVNDILKSVIGKFQQRINMVNTILPEISIDPNELTFSVGEKSEGMLDRRGSEWQRLAWLLSEAVAHFAGLGIWIVDRVDILDAKNKDLFLKLIQKVKNDYETILVTGTRDQRPDVQSNNGMKFFWVEDGKIT